MQNDGVTPQLSLIVLKRFRVIFGSMRQHFRRTEEMCGVTGSQLWLLQEVSKNPGIGVSDLADQLAIHQSTCSLLVDKLVQRQYLLKIKNSGDQRRVGLALSEQGSRLIRIAPDPARGILPEALDALPDDVLVALDRSLVELISQLKFRDDHLSETPLADL